MELWERMEWFVSSVASPFLFLTLLDRTMGVRPFVGPIYFIILFLEWWLNESQFI